MSDTTNVASESAEADNEEQPKKNFRRELEERAAQAEAKAAELERQLAFNSVKGLDMSTPAHKFFAENYKGELNAEAVAKAASDLGFLKESTEDTTSQREVNRLSQFDAASQGAEPAVISGTDEAKLRDILEGDFKNLDEYNAAVKNAGYAKNLRNG